MSLDPVCDGAFHAVDAHAGEAGSKAAHGNVSTFATIGARERHAGNALHGFGEVAVGELADVFGHDTVDGGRRFAFLAERGVQRSSETGDDDFLEFLRLLISCVLREGHVHREHQPGAG